MQVTLPWLSSFLGTQLALSAEEAGGSSQGMLPRAPMFAVRAEK